MSDIDEVIDNIKDLNKFKYDVFVKDLMRLATRVKELEKQNKRYREALNDVLNNDEMMMTNQEIILDVLKEESE